MSTADALSSKELQQRMKRRKVGHDYDCTTTSGGEDMCAVRRWKTEVEHQIYSSIRWSWKTEMSARRSRKRVDSVEPRDSG
ncbi:hypothetical protein LINPERHAP2_LOCUS7087 [Linum perenne]